MLNNPKLFQEWGIQSLKPRVKRLRKRIKTRNGEKPYQIIGVQPLNWWEIGKGEKIPWEEPPTKRRK